MNRENNRIKSAVEKLSLSDAAKRRIINGCADAEETSGGRAPRIKWTLVTAAVLVIAMTVGTFAAAGFFRRAPGKNKTHVGSDPELISTQDAEGVVTSDDGEFVFRCNSVTGGEEKVYFDCTLAKKDGGVVTELSSDGVELPIIDVTGTLKLTNGDERSVNFFTLSDSTETEYHIEGWVLMAKYWTEDADYDEYQDNKFYSADEIKELLDGATLAPGMIGARTVNTEPIALSDALIDELSALEPGDAVPNTEESVVYDENGNVYNLNQVECSLDVGNMNIPFSADGKITVDNFAFGPYHFHHADLSDVTALYLNLRGYEGNGYSFDFCTPDGTTLIYHATIVGNPAPGVKTFVISDTNAIDVTLESLAEATQMRSVNVGSEILCAFSSGIMITADYKNAVVDTTFDPVTISLDNGQIVLNSAHLTNTYISLFGTCSAEGELDLALGEAYVITDSGETVMLGSKNGVGTDKDGETFSITWQCATVIDPEKISEIHIADAVINVK